MKKYLGRRPTLTETAGEFPLDLAQIELGSRVAWMRHERGRTRCSYPEQFELNLGRILLPVGVLVVWPQGSYLEWIRLYGELAR